MMDREILRGDLAIFQGKTELNKHVQDIHIRINTIQ